jgi:hypothetical protein
MSGGGFLAYRRATCSDLQHYAISEPESVPYVQICYLLFLHVNEKDIQAMKDHKVKEKL